VKPDDAEDLSRALGEALLLPKDEKERIGRQAIEHVREHFSAELMCGRTLELYWELIGKRYE
jgi:glycosyltransferase involved in cell wall biosynthesis